MTKLRIRTQFPDRYIPEAFLNGEWVQLVGSAQGVLRATSFKCLDDAIAFCQERLEKAKAEEERRLAREAFVSEVVWESEP